MANNETRNATAPRRPSLAAVALLSSLLATPAWAQTSEQQAEQERAIEADQENVCLLDAKNCTGERFIYRQRFSERYEETYNLPRLTRQGCQAILSVDLEWHDKVIKHFEQKIKEYPNTPVGFFLNSIPSSLNKNAGQLQYHPECLGEQKEFARIKKENYNFSQPHNYPKTK